jgi:hypothetical protein
MTASETLPALEPELVHEFVLKAHGDLDTVKRASSSRRRPS